MAVCDAGGGCKITCPDGCGAIRTEDGCDTWCEPVQRPKPGTIIIGSLSTPVSGSFKGLKLASAAAGLANLTELRFAIPAELADKKVSRTFRNQRFSAVLKSLGLVPIRGRRRRDGLGDTRRFSTG